MPGLWGDLPTVLLPLPRIMKGHVLGHELPGLPGVLVSWWCSGSSDSWSKPKGSLMVVNYAPIESFINMCKARSYNSTLRDEHYIRGSALGLGRLQPSPAGEA